jgi:hypothetical protein
MPQVSDELVSSYERWERRTVWRSSSIWPKVRGACTS